MSRKKHKPSLRCFLFSPEMIQVTQKAMMAFTQVLARAESQSDNVAFAEETAQQIKRKLAAMAASVGATCLTNFDWNEKVMIAAAIHFYLLEPLTTSPSQRERDRKRCQHILRFALDPGQDDERTKRTHAENRNP